MSTPNLHINLCYLHKSIQIAQQTYTLFKCKKYQMLLSDVYSVHKINELICLLDEGNPILLAVGFKIQ